MQLLGLPALRRAAPLAPLVLRAVVGVVMAAHGWEKLTGDGGPAGFAEMLAGLGVPAPVAVAWLVTLIELVGGSLLVIGLLTRVAALLNAGVLVGAIALVKLEVGLIAEEGAGYELDLALLAGLVALAVLGPGRPSLDHLAGIERHEPVVADRVVDVREPDGARR